MGMVITSKRVPLLTTPTTVIQAGTLTVGSVVKLMEGGTAVDYLVVNQGIPENSSLYDSSCNGTWLLRKDIHSNRVWDSDEVSRYANSSINAWLNGDYFNSLGTIEQAIIKQVKIPYRTGGAGGHDDNTGANGLPCKVFLLGGYELGWTTSDNEYFPQDGAKLDYFESGNGTSANNKRIANLNDSADRWWLRSPHTNSTGLVWFVTLTGINGRTKASNSYGIRPALIIPSTAKFDETTLQLKGVA